MSKSYLYLFFPFFVLSLIIVSCKRDQPFEETAIIEVDFLMNEMDLQKLGLEFTEQELERNINDPNKVLTVKVGEPVKFKDTSGGPSSNTKRKWVLNDNEWKLSETKADGMNVPEFTYTFEDPGFHRISLYIGESNYATKLVKVVSGDYIAADQPLETMDVETPDESQSNDIVADQPTQRPQPTQPAPRPAPSNKSTNQPSSGSNNNTAQSNTKPAPEPAKITSVNFSIPATATVGQSFELKDLSQPSNAITTRQWDLGDGTTQKTRGDTYRHMYFSDGEKSVTLCLNNSDQCVTKRIMVKPKPVVAAAPDKPKDPAPAPPKKPEVTSVDFNLPETAVVGTSVNLMDRSQPSSAVVKRRWSFGDGTPDLNTGKSSVSHVFNKAGKYTVKVCVNDSDKCSSKEIEITEPVVVAEEKPASSATSSSNTATSESGGLDYSKYDGTRPGNVGLLSSQKCNPQEIKMSDGTATISLSPKKMMELEKAKVYADNNGTLDITLKNSKGSVEGELSGIQVNPGNTTIYLIDLAVILVPGEKYTLTIKSSGVKLEDSAGCSPNTLKSDVVSLNYGDNYILYDLAFIY